MTRESELALHPLCQALKPMSDRSLSELQSDIEANGLLVPIVLYQGMVLDGRHRYQACMDAGIEPRFEHLPDDADPASVVRALNLVRRHESKGSLAAALAAVADWSMAQGHGGARRGNQVATVPLEGIRDRARAAGVSERTQGEADRLARKSPELAHKVARGEMSLPMAAEEAGIRKKKPGLAQTEPEPEADEDRSVDPAALASELQQDLQRAEDRVQQLEKLLATDDTKSALLDLQRSLDAALAARDEAMSSAASHQQRARVYERMLSRCGKAVGQMDLDKVAPTVEAMARAMKGGKR